MVRKVSYQFSDEGIFDGYGANKTTGYMGILPDPCRAWGCRETHVSTGYESQFVWLSYKPYDNRFLIGCGKYTCCILSCASLDIVRIRTISREPQPVVEQP